MEDFFLDRARMILRRSTFLYCPARKELAVFIKHAPLVNFYSVWSRGSRNGRQGHWFLWMIALLLFCCGFYLLIPALVVFLLEPLVFLLVVNFMIPFSTSNEFVALLAIACGNSRCQEVLPLNLSFPS